MLETIHDIPVSKVSFDKINLDRFIIAIIVCRLSVKSVRIVSHDIGVIMWLRGYQGGIKLLTLMDPGNNM